MTIEVQTMTPDEVQYLSNLFAPSDRQAVQKMAAESVDENSCFDDLDIFCMPPHRLPAEKSAFDDDGNPDNAVMDSLFPFHREVQKGIDYVSQGIEDLRRTESARLDKMERTILQLADIVAALQRAS